MSSFILYFSIHMLKLFFITLLFILLSACSSHYNAGVVYHDNFDFSQVKSYSLYNRNSPFTDSQSLIGTRRNAIEIAIESTMSNHKFNYVEPEHADVIVTYFVFNGKPEEYSKYNEVVRFCVHGGSVIRCCKRWTMWGLDMCSSGNPLRPCPAAKRNA